MIKKFSEIYQKDETNHLLIGNGFNIHFGYDSSYKNIFELITKNNKDIFHEGLYEIIKKHNFNLELAFTGYKLTPELKVKSKLSAQKSIGLLKYEDTISRAKEIVAYLQTQKYTNALDSYGLCVPSYLYIASQTQKYINSPERKVILDSQVQGYALDFVISVFKFGFIDSLKKIMDMEKRERVMKAARFIKKFSNKKSNIFTLNYDSLLYNIGIELNRKRIDKQEWEMEDGFIEKRDGFLWEENSKQNFFHIHGALHIFQEEKDSFLWKNSSKQNLVLIHGVFYVFLGEKERVVEIRKTTGKNDKINNGGIWDIVFEGTSERKRDEIDKNKYMEYAFNRLSDIQGNLFLYGLSFFENDDHIWEAIKDNKSIEKFYVSVYLKNNNPSSEEAEKILDDFNEEVVKAFGGEESRAFVKEKVVFFDSDSINK